MVRSITRNGGVTVQAEAWPRLDLRERKKRDLKKGEGQAYKHHRWWSCEPWRLPVVAMVMENRRWCPTYSKVWWKRENFWNLVTVQAGILGIFDEKKASIVGTEDPSGCAVKRESFNLWERERENIDFCSRGGDTSRRRVWNILGGEIVFL